MPSVTGYIEISFQRDKSRVYQTIHILANEHKNLHYFMNEKYELGRTVDDFVAGKYIGNAADVVFTEAQKFRNIIRVTYTVKKGAKPVLSEKKYFIEGTVPPYDSCDHCKHMGRLEGTRNVRCAYYRKILPPKVYCRDFFERPRPR